MQVGRIGIGVVMAEWENRIFCRLDGLTLTAREQKRLMALKELNLIDTPTIPVFDEATQTAARFLDAPICILGLMTLDQQLIKSAIGLSRVGLMNQWAQSRQLPRLESFCTYVVDSHQALVITDTATNPIFAKSVLVGYYGIRAYMGVPLLTADGQCLGTLAVMDWEARNFTNKDLEFLTITARWSICEFERNRLLQQETTRSIYLLSQAVGTYNSAQEQDANAITQRQEHPHNLPTIVTSTNFIKLRLLTQLTQELRTPLTSVMGMASVLNRQVYGPLTTKQKEYLEIIHRSGQHLVTLVEEIASLGFFDETATPLNLSNVDVEMLCQKALNCLFDIAQARQQQIRLSIEPGNRIWLLDKDKVQQILYYLLFSVIHAAEGGGEVRVHVSRHPNKLKISIWVSHPWLGDGIPPVYGRMPASPLPLTTCNIDEISDGLETSVNNGKVDSSEPGIDSCQFLSNQIISGASLLTALTLMQELKKTPTQDESRESLGLILSYHLAELHKGQITVQGSLERGYRYVISLPQLESIDEKI